MLRRHSGMNTRNWSWSVNGDPVGVKIQKEEVASKCSNKSWRWKNGKLLLSHCC